MLCPSCFHDKRDTNACPYPNCGFEESDNRDSRFLPYRHPLRRGRYVVGQVLGRPGGFGIAYKALDVKRGAIVVIKECLLTESKQVSREAGDVVVQVNQGFEAEYRRWLGRFRVEAELISLFGSPYIVRVSEVFEENNTAYYVMPFVEGEDLVQYCTSRGSRLPEDEVTRFATHLLSALTEMHGKGVVHRDIKPSNVLITRNRRKPVLIDFGAARDSFDVDQSRSQIAVHSPAYAPIEQVELREDQGPWTDIYALCATLHFCLLAEPPPRAIERYDPEGRKPDPFIPIHVRMPHIGLRLATVIDNGLALSPQRRLRDAATAIRILGSDDTIPSSLAPGSTADSLGPPNPQPPPAVGLLGALGALWLRIGRTTATELQADTTTTGSGPSTIQASRNSMMGIEIQLQSDGQATVVRSIRPKEKLIIGRTHRSDLIYPMPLLSSQHVSIEVTVDGEFRLHDMDSLNHTYLYERGPDGTGTWNRIKSASGRKGRFALGPPDGGVVLEIRQTTIES